MTDETGSLRLFKTFSFLILSSWCLRNYLSEKNKRPTKAFLPLAIAFFSFTDWIFLIHDIIKKSIFSRSALCLQKVVWKPRRKLISDLFFTSFLSYSPPIPPPPQSWGVLLLHWGWWRDLSTPWDAQLWQKHCHCLPKLVLRLSWAEFSRCWAGHLLAVAKAAGSFNSKPWMNPGELNGGSWTWAVALWMCLNVIPVHLDLATTVRWMSASLRQLLLSCWHF